MDISYSNGHPAPDLHISLLGGDGVQTGRKKPAQLSTARMKVLRQATRGAILSILETGHVSIEFVRRRGGQDRLVELFVVSGDGQEVCIEQTRAGDSSILADSSEEGDVTWKTFTYDTLPEKYWKKYSHAYRFVELVKSKTAKVTMYSDRAKGVLMENYPPNFEASFFNGGPRMVMVGGEVHIREDNGASLILHRDSLHGLVNAFTLDLIQHASQMREQCVRLECSVMTVQAMSSSSEPLFPVTVGMRPSTSFCSSTSSTSGSMDLLPFPTLHPSPPASQGPSLSPPSSPVRNLDLRFPQTPQKSGGAAPGAVVASPVRDVLVPLAAAESPVRHVSTLEGRQMRRHFSRSAESTLLDLTARHPHPHPATLHHSATRLAAPQGFESRTTGQQQQHLQHQRSNPVAAPHGFESRHITTPRHNQLHPHHHPPHHQSNPLAPNGFESRTAAAGHVSTPRQQDHSAGDDDFEGVSTGHALAHSQVFGAELDLSVAAAPGGGFLTSTPGGGFLTSTPGGGFLTSTPCPAATWARRGASVQQPPASLTSSSSPFMTSLPSSLPSSLSSSAAGLTSSSSLSSATSVCSGFHSQPSQALLPLRQTDDSFITDSQPRNPSPTSSSSAAHQPPVIASALLHAGPQKSAPLSSSPVVSATHQTTVGQTASSLSSSTRPTDFQNDPADDCFAGLEGGGGGEGGVVRQAFVAYTGWASLLASGTVWVRYNDGTQLAVTPAQTQLVYVDQEGQRHRFARSDTMPEIVKQKLERLPAVVSNLYNRPSTAPFSMAPN